MKATSPGRWFWLNKVWEKTWDRQSHRLWQQTWNLYKKAPRGAFLFQVSFKPRYRALGFGVVQLVQIVRLNQSRRDGNGRSYFGTGLLRSLKIPATLPVTAPS